VVAVVVVLPVAEDLAEAAVPLVAEDLAEVAVPLVAENLVAENLVAAVARAQALLLHNNFELF